MSSKKTVVRDHVMDKQPVLSVKPLGEFVLIRQVTTIPKLMINNPKAKVLEDYEYNAEYYVVAKGDLVCNVEIGDRVSVNNALLIHSKYNDYKDSYSLDIIREYINDMKADERAKFWHKNDNTVRCHNYFIGIANSFITAIIDSE